VHEEGNTLALYQKEVPNFLEVCFTSGPPLSSLQCQKVSDHTALQSPEGQSSVTVQLRKYHCWFATRNSNIAENVTNCAFLHLYWAGVSVYL